jgi:hypothetical protein
LRVLHLTFIALAVLSLPLIVLEPISLAWATADQLLAKTRSCDTVSAGTYRTHDSPATVPICRSGSVFFWNAGMSIDCDGVASANCNALADPSYQPQTLCLTSTGQPLSAEETPYFVIPLPSWRFDYRSAGIKPGTLGAVIYDNKLVYAVFADVGPNAAIGEASYATARALGINPEPGHGGVGSGVTYIVFTGQVLDLVENNAMINRVGAVAADLFVRA